MGSLTFNGGAYPMQTILPLTGSPLIDAGLTSSCPATDQRGVARPDGAACDIGAVEIVQVVYAIAVAGKGSLIGLPGATVAHTVLITNTGNTADTIDLALGMTAWNSQLGQTSVSLNAGQNATVTVTVAVPANAADGTANSVTVTATSQGDTGQTATVGLTTTAKVAVSPANHAIYLPLIMRP